MMVRQEMFVFRRWNITNYTGFLCLFFCVLLFGSPSVIVLVYPQLTNPPNRYQALHIFIYNNIIRLIKVISSFRTLFQWNRNNKGNCTHINQQQYRGKQHVDYENMLLFDSKTYTLFPKSDFLNFIWETIILIFVFTLTC